MNETILRTIRSQTLERIAEITASPKPSYKIEDQQVDWNEYLQSLQKTVEWIDKQLQSNKPFELVSRGVCR